MTTNNFKAFGIGAGANVMSQSDYEALAALLTGFQSGKASSAQINKALRQSSTMAYVLAQFISDSASVDVLDNGTPATILANMKAAMTALTPGRLLGVQVFKASGTYTPTPGARAIMVEVLGGGGGGGNASAADGNSVSLGLGAGGAGYAKSYLTDVPASAAVIVGSGGSPASDGGRSVFNGTLIANGGKAGRSEISGSWTGGTALQQVGSPGGTASAGNILNVNGGDGVTALYTSSGNCVSGGGGSSFLSGAVRGVGGSTGNGNNNSLGGGGSGANATGTTDTLSGGEGGDGIVIITEYA